MSLTACHGLNDYFLGYNRMNNDGILMFKNNSPSWGNPAQQWIKCEDRMPDKDGRYLVAEKFHFGIDYWVGVSSLRNGKWDVPLTRYWQELPEAPEE